MIAVQFSLFKDILSCVRRKSKEGKRKGGIKVHTVINACEKDPSLVWFSPTKTYEHNFLQQLKCDNNTISVFDKAYNDYKAFKFYKDQKIGYVTRIKYNAVYDEMLIKDICEDIHSGVVVDVIIEIKVKEGKQILKLYIRKVKFYDRESKRDFEYITNLFKLRADLIAPLYKVRLRIELVFK